MHSHSQVCCHVAVTHTHRSNNSYCGSDQSGTPALRAQYRKWLQEDGVDLEDGLEDTAQFSSRVKSILSVAAQ